MPLLLIPLAALGIFLAGEGASALGKDAADAVTGVPQASAGGPGTTTPVSIIPSWVIPTGLLLVGGLLLYKKGAQILKV